MTLERLDFYKGKVMINLLARDLDNAVEVAEALDGHVLVGVLTKNYPTVEACVADVKAYMKKLTNVSVGLGPATPSSGRWWLRWRPRPTPATPTRFTPAPCTARAPWTPPAAPTPWSTAS